MKTIPPIFRKFWSQLLHFTLCPVFFFLFILVYSPGNSESFFDAGRGLYALNVTIYSTILLVLMTGTRLTLFYVKKMKLNWPLYLLWCFGEVLLMSFFCALYMHLVALRSEAYFAVLGKTVILDAAVLVFPYTIISLILLANSSENGSQEGGENDRLIRFLDENKKLKFVIAASAVVYIESEENYIRVHYTEGENDKDYLVRSSMKSLEETLKSHGIVRCHRSFFVNPSHIKILRKNAEGILVADLDQKGMASIPVSKRYYESLSNLL